MRVGSNIRANGNGQNIVGSNARVVGDDNVVTGSNARVTGNRNTVTGSNARITGNNNRGTGSNAVINGNDNVWTGSNCRVASGTGNVINKPEATQFIVNRFGGGQVITTNGTSIGIGDGIFTIGNVGDNGSVSVSSVGGGAIAVGSKRTKGTLKKRQRKEDELLETLAEVTTKRHKEIKFVEGPPESDLEHDIESQKDCCCICLSNKALCIVLPCRHVCLCVSCARILCFEGDDAAPKERGRVKCPKCRAIAKKVVRVH